MYGFGGLEQVEVVKRRRKAKWLEEEKKEEEEEEEKEKTKDRSVPDGSDNYSLKEGLKKQADFWDTLYIIYGSWISSPSKLPESSGEVVS